MAIRFKGERFLQLIMQKGSAPNPVGDVATRIGIPLDVCESYCMGALPGPKVVRRMMEVLEVNRDELMEICSSDQAGLVWMPTGKITWERRSVV